LQSARRKRIGRPGRRESQALISGILVAAAALFREQGYAATSIEQIARATGSGKQTIYRRFGGKERLFQAVMEAHSARVAARVSRSAVGGHSLLALRRTTRAMFDHMLSGESVALHRILVAEAVRFPDLVLRTFDHAIGPYSALTVRLIEAAQAEGRLGPADSKRLFGMLTGLLTGWPHQQALLGRDVLPTAAARAAFFATAWALFITGAGPESASDRSVSR
jgi:AcrR family transcriptional regulator